MTIKKTFHVTINSEQCKGCERCVNACVKNCLSMGTKLNKMGYAYAVYASEGCIGCGACFYNCPEPGAITITQTEEDDDNAGK